MLTAIAAIMTSPVNNEYSINPVTALVWGGGSFRVRMGASSSILVLIVLSYGSGGLCLGGFG
jgi:hypothetical protein